MTFHDTCWPISAILTTSPTSDADKIQLFSVARARLAWADSVSTQHKRDLVHALGTLALDLHFCL